MKELLSLYKIHSPSRYEGAMVAHIKSVCSRIRNCSVSVDEVGNVYVTKRKRGYNGTYPCIVAHTDQVQRAYSKDYNPVIFKNQNGEGVIIGYSRRNRQFEGLGADDKNGIWVALKMLKECDNMKAAFFVSEEIGCLGSYAADMEFFTDCRFVIECDRRGNSDFITEISIPLCSRDFVRDAKINSFGYHEAKGLMTDVNTLVNRGIGISCCNISCGYYEPHTNVEHTVIPDLERCLELVRHIFRNCNKVYPYSPHFEIPKYGGDYRTDEICYYDFHNNTNEPYEWFYENIDINAYTDMSDEELEKAYLEDIEPWLTQEQLSHYDWKKEFKEYVNDCISDYYGDEEDSLFRP